MWFPKIGEEFYFVDRTPPPIPFRREGGYDQEWALLAALGQIVKTEEEARRIHDEAKEKARKALEPEPWRPTDPGQGYFYASTDEGGRLILFPDYYQPGEEFDEMRIAAGNCFETEEDGLEYIEAERKVRDEIRMKQAKRKAAKK